MTELSRHSAVMSRAWTDNEPDTLTVEVQTDETNGQAFVTFTGSSTWLDPVVVRNQVVPWVLNCCDTAIRMNSAMKPLSGMAFTRDQIEAWAGRSLTDEEVDRLSDCAPNSSIPDAVSAIVESFSA